MPVDVVVAVLVIVPVAVPVAVGVAVGVSVDVAVWLLVAVGVIEAMPDQALFSIIHPGPTKLLFPRGRRLQAAREQWWPFCRGIISRHLDRSSSVFAILSVIFGGESDSTVGWVCYFLAIAQFLIIGLAVFMLVKTVNGCGLNDRHWIFYAPVTDVHYKIVVYDDVEDVVRVFLGYQGLTAGATDTDAFNTCP